MRLAIVLFLTCAGYSLASDPDALTGRWEGAIEIPGAEATLIVDLAQTSDGLWTGSAIMPGFGIKGAPLSDIKVDGSNVTFALKRKFEGSKFAGQVTAQNTLSGDFTLAGNTAPFNLRKAGPPQVEAPRAATPVSKDLEGEWSGDFDVPGSKVHVKITLTNSSGGTAAKMVMGVKNENNLPVDFVAQEADWLTVESHETSMAFQGRYRAVSQEISGYVLEGGFEIPLVLHRMPDTNAHR